LEVFVIINLDIKSACILNIVVILCWCWWVCCCLTRCLSCCWCCLTVLLGWLEGSSRIVHILYVELCHLCCCPL